MEKPHLWERPFWKKPKYSSAEEIADSMRHAESVAPDDVSNIPPPPLILPAKETIRHVAPPAAVLQRYKTRAGGAQSLPEIDQDAVTSAKQHRRATSSTGDVLQQPNSPRQFERGASEPIKVRPSRFTSPLKFNMVKPGERTADKPKASSEGDIMTAAREGFSRRSTRSQTRREERVDSHRDSTSSQSSSKVIESSVEVPAALNIRKQSASSRSPEPPTFASQDMPQPLSSHPAAARDLDPNSDHSSPTGEDQLPASRPLPETPDVLTAWQPSKIATTRSPRSFTELALPPVVLSKSREDKSSPRTRTNLISNPQQNQVDQDAHSAAASTTSEDTPDTDDDMFLDEDLDEEEEHEQDEDNVTEIYPVPVRPPMFNMNRGPHQWISDHTSSSRPSSSWGWAKRWTCCECEVSTTIVEQTICSNLECKHYRCPDRCKMIKLARHEF